MALYDFVCNQCDHDFEVFSTGFIKDDQKKCPQCGSTDAQQRFRSFLRTDSSSSTGCAPVASSGFG